jgi:fumarate reductase iron-sulfur subunit
VTQLDVFRWAPGDRERAQRYEVAAGADTTVLDALVAVQREQDPTLAFRYACRVGMCGSCAMVVNGRERWACRTRLADLGSGAVRVRPLYHFPLLRDLVVDMMPFVARQRAVGAALAPAADAALYARIPSTSDERAEIDEAIECIGCGMCLSACTMVAHDARFVGPAALNRAFTLQRDRRDAGRDARWATLLADDALPRCHGQGGCTDVCPMGLAPTGSIIRLRRMAVLRLVGRGRAASQAGTSGGGTDDASRANSFPG